MTDPRPHADPEEGPPSDHTLGGYLEKHDRPPAFEGSDGHPYTVSMEMERTGDLRAPFLAYLVFPRWAQTGVGIVGHLESATLLECRTPEEAEKHLADLTLHEVQAILEEALRRAASDDREPRGPHPDAP